MEKKRNLLRIRDFWKSLWFLPFLLMFLLDFILAAGLGFVWVYEHGFLYYFLSIGAVGSLLAFALGWMWIRSRCAVPEFQVPDEEYWSNCEKVAMTQVREYIEGLDISSLNWLDMTTDMRLLQNITRRVATVYHPGRTSPELHVPLAHVMIVAERVARDLRQKFAEDIPGMYFLTLNHVLYAKAMYDSYPQWNRFYRAGAFLWNPISGVFREGRRWLGIQVTNEYSKRLQSSTLEYALTLAGRYAVELYSGRLRFEDEQEKGLIPTQPVAALVLGQRGVGKSAFCQRFLGPELGIPCEVQDTEGYELPKKSFFGLWEQQTSPFEKYLEAMKRSDVLFLVHDSRKNAQRDVEFLQAFEAWKNRNPEVTPPVLLLVVTGLEILAEKSLSPEVLESEVSEVSEKPDVSGELEKRVEAILKKLSLPLNTPIFPLCTLSLSEGENEDGSLEQVEFLSFFQAFLPEIRRIQEAHGVAKANGHTGVRKTAGQITQWVYHKLGLSQTEQKKLLE